MCSWASVVCFACAPAFQSHKHICCGMNNLCCSASIFYHSIVCIVHFHICLEAPFLCKVDFMGGWQFTLSLLTFQMLNAEEAFISEAWSVTSAKVSIKMNHELLFREHYSCFHEKRAFATCHSSEYWPREGYCSCRLQLRKHHGLGAGSDQHQRPPWKVRRQRAGRGAENERGSNDGRTDIFFKYKICMPK